MLSFYFLKRSHGIAHSVALEVEAELDNPRKEEQITHTNLCRPLGFHMGLEMTMSWVPCEGEMKVMCQGHRFIYFFITVTEVPMGNNLWRKTFIWAMLL